MAPPFVRASVAAMDGYIPGEQPSAGERVVKLNTNENPYPPSPKVIAALKDVEGELLRRYPDPFANSFRDAAAKKWGAAYGGFGREHFICGNGSDDILTIATRTFVAAGGTVAFPDPTYSLYPVLAGLQDARIVRVPWGAKHALPSEKLAESGASLIYVANPNAPTGTFVRPEAIAELAEAFSGAIVVDEAYCDFADGNCMGLVAKHRNIIVARTLSKSYSLAGLRFGYAAAQPDVIEEMMKLKDSYNCDALSVVAATAAIADEEYSKGIWEQIRAERGRLAGELEKLGYEVLPSHANFLLASVPGGQGKQVYQRLKQQGILVRFFDKPGLQDKLRITVGTSNENNALLAGLENLKLTEKAA